MPVETVLAERPSTHGRFARLARLLVPGNFGDFYRPLGLVGSRRDGPTQAHGCRLFHYSGPVSFNVALRLFLVSTKHGPISVLTLRRQINFNWITLRRRHAESRQRHPDQAELQKVVSNVSFIGILGLLVETQLGRTRDPASCGAHLVPDLAVRNGRRALIFCPTFMPRCLRRQET